MLPDSSIPEEMTLGHIVQALWNKKLLIAVFTLSAAAFSVTYALSIDNVYESKTVLAPKGSGSDSLSGLAAQFGGLASLAGVRMPLAGEEVSKSKLAQEKMRTLSFFATYLYPEILQDLVAIKSWDETSRKLVYDTDLYDPEAEIWVKQGAGRPSHQEAFKAFQSIFSVSEDPMTGMVTLRARHKSPTVAKAWLDLIVSSITEDLRAEDITEAEESIKFLQQQQALTRLVAIEEVFSQLIEEQLKVVMLAKVSKNYVYQVIEPAFVPEEKISPRRSAICIFGTLIGLILGVAITLTQRFAKL